MIKQKVMTCIIISILIAICCSPISAKIGEENEESFVSTISEKEWTIMLYDDADFYMAFDPLDWFALEASSSANINVLVLQDKEHDSATLWYIDENHSKISLKEMGEVNMGDYVTLFDFINYSKMNYPAERYMLFFYDHGMGWEGACIDNESDNDFLTMDEIQHALTDTGSVDVVCFSAPCLMGAIESAYELRNCTEIYIGSEELSGYIYWGYIIGKLCILLNEDLNISNVKVGRSIIELIKNEISPFSKNDMDRKAKTRKSVTMSAIDTSKLDVVASSIDQLARDLSFEIETGRFKINLIQAFSQPFAKFSPMLKASIIDVYDFSKKCSTFFFINKTICTDAKNLMSAIDDAVIANLKGINHPRAHGLTIYFPPTLSNYKTNYSLSELDFTRDTYWDEFLISYLS